MKRLPLHSATIVVLLAMFIFHLFSKDFSNPYERPISGDAQAYYAYLPAIFIYHDLDYGFVDEMNAKYYPASHQKSFLKESGDGKVNKTFPGVAILYLPFFLIAHALALLFGMEADGYATIYQVCFDLGLWVYLFLGLIGLKKVLRSQGFAHQTTVWTNIILLLGTNIFFYSVYDQSVTHIYNFFMINWFIWFFIKYRETQALKPLLWATLLIALIGITRPTNVLVLGLVVFFLPERSFYQKLFKSLCALKNLIPISIIAFSILFIPFLLWKLQTNQWVVYSYGEEGFNFSDPHFLDFLFSYLKGWWVYTPIAFFVVIFGLIALFRTNKKRSLLALLFYFVTIYVFSSWWCWYYGAGMSQRVMIDHFVLFGFLLSLLLERLKIVPWKWSLKQISLTAMIGLFIFLNIAQAWQIRHGILTGGSATADQYWDNFLVFEKRARVYPHEHWTLEESHQINLHPDSPRIKKGTPLEIEGVWSLEVTEWQPYSTSIYLPLDNLREGSKMIISFDARSRHDAQLTRAVVELDDERQVFGLDQYLKKDEWVRIEYLIEPNHLIKETPFLFFWNGGSQEKVEFRNFGVKHYFSEAYL